MNFSRGLLSFEPATARPELVAAPVAATLLDLPGRDAVGVASIDPAVADTAAFCERYGVMPAQTANCVIVEGRRGEAVRYAACLVLATTRADVNKTVKKLLEVSKISFATREDAVAKSGMEFGGITPIGLPEDWPIFIDRTVADAERVIIGSGIRASKLSAPGAVLAALPGARVIDGLGLQKSA